LAELVKMAIVYPLVVIICMVISSLDDENETKILRKYVEDLTCTKTVPRCSPNFHQIIRSVVRFTASLTKINPIIENLLFKKAKEGLTSFWARVDPLSDKLNPICVHETSQHKEKSYPWDTKILIKCIPGQMLFLCSIKPQMVNETIETLTSLENNAEIIGFEEEQRTFKSTEKSSIDVGLIATFLCLVFCLRQCEITVNLKMKQSKMERISLRVTPNFKHSLEDVLTSFNESDFVNTEHTKISRCLTFPTAIPDSSKLVVYPASAVSLLASYRPLMYMELPNSVFFVQLSAHGFRYPGTGSSVLCVGCENSVDLSLFTSDPSCAIYHKPGCQFVKVGTIETASTHSRGGTQSESTLSSEASRGIEHTSLEASQSFSETSSVLQSPAYPVYRDSKKRLESFVNWSTDHVHSINDLVNEGFFYAENARGKELSYSDCVRCFQCGLGLKSWRPGDSIRTEHERFRPSCAFLKTQISHKPRSNIHNEQSQMSRVQSTMASSATCGTDKTKDNENTEDLAHIAVQQQQIEEIQIAAASEEKTTEGCIESQEAISQKLLQRENEALKQQMKCKSCQTADVQDLFLPCGHMSTCKQCSNKFSQCPACGKRILGTVNVYFA
ncbi:baculoviral IAP repeat-containing protein 2 isoform X1, partial [Biomphalaria glabrata]